MRKEQIHDRADGGMVHALNFDLKYKNELIDTPDSPAFFLYPSRY